MSPRPLAPAASDPQVIDLTNSPSPPLHANTPLPNDLFEKTPICIGQIHANALVLSLNPYVITPNALENEWTSVRLRYEPPSPDKNETIQIRTLDMKTDNGEMIPGEMFGVVEQKATCVVGPLLYQGRILIKAQVRKCARPLPILPLQMLVYTPKGNIPHVAKFFADCGLMLDHPSPSFDLLRVSKYPYYNPHNPPPGGFNQAFLNKLGCGSVNNVGRWGSPSVAAKSVEVQRNQVEKLFKTTKDGEELVETDARKAREAREMEAADRRKEEEAREQRRRDAKEAEEQRQAAQREKSGDASSAGEKARDCMSPNKTAAIVDTGEVLEISSAQDDDDEADTYIVRRTMRSSANKGKRKAVETDPEDANTPTPTSKRLRKRTALGEKVGVTGAGIPAPPIDVSIYGEHDASVIGGHPGSMEWCCAAAAARNKPCPHPVEQFTKERRCLPCQSAESTCVGTGCRVCRACKGRKSERSHSKARKRTDEAGPSKASGSRNARTKAKKQPSPKTGTPKTRSRGVVAGSSRTTHGLASSTTMPVLYPEYADHELRGFQQVLMNAEARYNALKAALEEVDATRLAALHAFTAALLRREQERAEHAEVGSMDGDEAQEGGEEEEEEEEGWE